MKRTEPTQQRVSELVPFRPNNTSSLVASDGEAVSRFFASRTTPEFLQAAQYGTTRADETARSGAGVCSDVNNVLFRSVVAQEARRPARPMADRAAGASTSIKRLPVSYNLNRDPHAFVMIGDPRDPRQVADTVVADSWEDLPIVKNWNNTSYNQLPYTVRMQWAPGSSAFQDRPLSSFSALAEQRPSQVRDEEEGEAVPSLSQIAQGNSRLPLFNVVSTTRTLRAAYEEDGAGERFTPSINLRDYQKVRAAVAHPLYDSVAKTADIDE
ncbi:hypothetical protein [Rhizosaccharibacter radicis]|uniref:Uncharacterized protein n=1 Tax=Rhizosaccharibacter radicis TaxID=2782605 RepID=A0ABT1VWT4_9PROT|nr:hypothetical protein [Acetobacteraceae bacterium KSS12]